MTAIPLTPGAAAKPGPHRFGNKLATLERRQIERWNRTPGDPPLVGAPVRRPRRFANARAARRLIDQIAGEVERFPAAESNRAAWRRCLEARIRRFGEERLAWPAGYRRLLFADAYFYSSVDFARRARRFNPHLEPSEIGQALRNVWIMNSLQLLLDRELELTDSIFAYSMLYPETDNFLDDPAVDGAAKGRFNELLERRIRGEPVAAADPRLRRVFRLVGLIERDWPRSGFPEVYDSLLAIHRAQVGSLAQDLPDARPAAGRILALSVAKGGASVLADGYLVGGRLSSAEAEFCFGYGIFLQLLDDLQDRDSDRAAGHATLFSTAPAGPAVDRLASRLHRFMRRTVEGSPRFGAPRHRASRDLIVRNCTMLLVSAVADQPAAFSLAFRRGLERRWPLGLGAMRRLRRRADKRFRRAWTRLASRRGVGSPLDLL